MAVGAVIVLVTSIVLLAWSGNPGHLVKRSRFNLDTIPSKSTEKDFDKELRQLDQAKKNLEELKNKDWDKIHRDVEEAIKKLDLDEIHLQIESLEKIDIEEIGRKIEESLNKIDFDKIEQEMEEVKDDIPGIDMENIKQELQKARLEAIEQLQKKEWKKEMDEAKEINLKEVGKEMEKVKDEMRRVKEELKLEKLDMKETLTKANEEIERARKEVESYQEMIYAMEKDGLLSTHEDYTIKHADGELFINGKKQSEQIVNKYKKYFSKDRVVITKQDGDLKIDNDLKEYSE
jgi:DNA repair exonuclease SbcCD ATPase subunit